jgi:hypothetical protein
LKSGCTICELERFLVDQDARIRRFLREVGPELRPDYRNASERLDAVDTHLRILSTRSATTHERLA